MAMVYARRRAQVVPFRLNFEVKILRLVRINAVRRGQAALWGLGAAHPTIFSTEVHQRFNARKCALVCLSQSEREDIVRAFPCEHQTYR